MYLKYTGCLGWRSNSKILFPWQTALDWAQFFLHYPTFTSTVWMDSCNSFSRSYNPRCPFNALCIGSALEDFSLLMKFRYLLVESTVPVATRQRDSRATIFSFDLQRLKFTWARVAQWLEVLCVTHNRSIDRRWFNPRPKLIKFFIPPRSQNWRETCLEK